MDLRFYKKGKARESSQFISNSHTGQKHIKHLHLKKVDKHNRIKKKIIKARINFLFKLFYWQKEL